MNTLTTAVVKSAAETAIEAVKPTLKVVAPVAKNVAIVTGAYIGSFAVMGVVMSVGPRVMKATYDATEAAISGVGTGFTAVTNGIGYSFNAVTDSAKSAGLAIAAAPQKLFNGKPVDGDNVIHLPDQSNADAIAA